MKYLIKVRMDENDGDYNYGIGIISLEKYEVIKNNPSMPISVPVEWDIEKSLSECIYEAKEITNLEADILKRLGLNDFGVFNNLMYQIEEMIKDGYKEDLEEDEN